MSPWRSTRTPELKVVLDSSAIFTGSASDLLRTEVCETIKTNSAFPDLTVTWHLPEIVVHERQYQMLRRALDLLPAIEKLERVLGHNLNITAEILEHRVAETVKAQIGAFGLSVCPLHIARVDWSSLVRASVFRKPPFEPGEKEKGFRDAIVIETFMQLVEDSPVTPKVCRMAMVSADKLLADTLKARASQATNVRVLETLEELTGLINTLVADVDEEFVGQLVPKAERYFFMPKEELTLYYSQKLGDKLSEQFKAELAAVPPGATRRSNERWLIAAPRFLRKEGQRVFWASRITIEATAFAHVPPPRVELWPAAGAETLASIKPSSIVTSESASVKLSGGIRGLFPTVTASELSPSFWNPYGSVLGEEKEVAKGRTALEVDWSVAVSTSRALSAPRIDGLRFIETVWN